MECRKSDDVRFVVRRYVKYCNPACTYDRQLLRPRSHSTKDVWVVSSSNPFKDSLSCFCEDVEGACRVAFDS